MATDSSKSKKTNGTNGYQESELPKMSYFVPECGVSVEATSPSEAVQLAREEMKKREAERSEATK